MKRALEDFPDVFYLDDQGELQLEEIKQIIARGEISPTGQLTITREVILD